MDEEEEGHEDEGGGRLPRGEGRRRRRTGGGDESTVGHFHASSERGKPDGWAEVGAAAVALITAGEAWERGACRRQEGPPSLSAAVHQSLNSRDSERDESFRTSK